MNRDRQRLCSAFRLLSIALLALSAQGLAAASFYTLTTNGPGSNRLSIVFLAEGYTSAQEATFQEDCTNALKAIFGGDPYTGEQPFVEYGNYFNAYAIFTNSVDSGADHPNWFAYRDTVFNCSYDAAYDYVITNDATGQSRINSLLTTFMPTNQFCYRLPVLLVNEPAFQGGSGGTAVIVSSGGNLQGILVHEIGHVLAGLGDEYESIPYAQGIDAGTFPAEPNTTTNTAYASIPWRTWIDTNNTPIPTPTTGDYFNSIGLFEGAHYSATGWYRPRLNCRMRSVTTDVPFCEVCREALVKAFYPRVRAIDTILPTNTFVTLNSGQAATFGVTPLQPQTHPLSIQWRTNGSAVASATNASFQLVAQPGLTNLSVIVRDTTDWVRNDPSNVVASTNSWSLNSLWLEFPQALPTGQFRFTVRGIGVTSFSIRASTNLVNWSSLSTNVLIGGEFNFTNSALSGIPWRYYRVRSPH